MGVGVFRPCLASRAVLAVFALALAPVAHAQTPFKVTLNGKIEGPEAPFLLAIEQGYFKAEGLEVTVEPSNGGLEPITRVASGGFDIGFGDISTLIRYRDGASAVPVKAVFVVFNRPTFAVIGRKSRGVTSPGTLEGKRMAVPPADNASSFWPVFAKVNDLDLSKITAINAGVAVREPMLAAGEVDAVIGRSYSTPFTLREKGVPSEDISVMLMGAYGVQLYGSSIFVHPKVLAEKPEAVRGFLRAFLRALKDTIRDPNLAAASVVRRTGNPGGNGLELERLLVAIGQSVLTPEVRERGLGAIDPARFGTALEQLALVHTFRTPPKLDDVFDPQFLPPPEERQLE